MNRRIIIEDIEPELVAYVERTIIPHYAEFDSAHGIDHVRTVIAESLRLAEHYPVEPDLVYTIAAFHDTGLCNGRERHHLDSGIILAGDPFVGAHFTPTEITTMREAVEDHRASSERAPRTVYGRIVAEADRIIDPEITLRRTVQYGLDHLPAATREEHYARMQSHLRNKYAAGGYMRLWCPESGNAERLEQLRCIIADEAGLRRRFDEIYDSLHPYGR